MATWDIDPYLGHSVSLSLMSYWKQFRSHQGQILNSPVETVKRSVWGKLVLLCLDLPNLAIKDLEDRKIDLKHELLRMILGNHYLAPEIVQANLSPRNGPAPAVLDIGTGTGSWAISMANEFPHAEVTGMDLVTPEPFEEVPPNCKFVVDDANLDLAHYANCFDVIHGRLVDIGIHDYPRFLNQVARMLRPGGILLLVKAFYYLLSENCEPLPVNEEGELGFTFLQKMFTASFASAMKRGSSENALLQYEYWLTNNPNFVPYKTVVRDLYIPISPWGTGELDPTSIQICEMMRMNLRALMRSFKSLLLSDGHPEDVIDHWTMGAENELKTLSVRGYSKWRFAWAIRRDAAWVEWEA